MAESNVPSAGYFFLNSELGTPLGALGGFLTAATTWAGSASHYTLAIAVGASAAFMFALAFCAASTVSARFKHRALFLTVIIVGISCFRVNQYSKELMEKNQHAVAPLPSSAPSITVRTRGDQAPAVAGSSGTVVTYNTVEKDASSKAHAK